MPSKRQRVLATYISKRRLAHGLNQQELADQLGVTKTTVSYWESGTYAPQATVLEPLAQALGVSYEDLAARSDRAIPAVMPKPPTYLRKLYPGASRRELAEAKRMFDKLDAAERRRTTKRPKGRQA